MHLSERLGPWRKAAGPAVALAVGVIAWEQTLHAARGVVAAGPAPSHLMLDASLALPLALIAVAFGRRYGALVTAGSFTLLLVPSVGAHHALHAIFASDPEFPRALAHVTHAAQAEGSALTHGLRDALAAFPVALVIAAVTLGSKPRAHARRTAVAMLAAATAFTVLPASAGPPITPFTVPLRIPDTLTTQDVTLTAQQTAVPILPGTPTTMWTFNGTFPGPTIRRPSGQTTRVKVLNRLPEAGELTLHHHGNHSTSLDDGQPHDRLIPPGGELTYAYDLLEAEAPERGAFQWYHDHRMDVTGRNVWMGLAGMVILDDPAEASINAALPNGARDVPLMIVDRTFDGENQIDSSYTGSSEGVFGDTILVNGAPQPYFEVADVKYRLRLLNASNVRSYDFALSDGRPMIQIASESGLLPAPISRKNLLLGPAERAEVIIDFSDALGQKIVLKNNAGFLPGVSQVMEFRVGRHETDASTVPDALRAAPSFIDPPIGAVRNWTLGRDLQDGMWTINGNGFDPERIDAEPKLGTSERWIFTNTTSADHIVHIHDVDWRVIARSPATPLQPDGLLGDTGLRESFRIRPNEVITVESRFTDHLGKYVLHCHMLEHEDFAMMAQFQVV